ncbi:MAG: tRNA pseudouridine(38-40) synthase TruA [Firmicutes bacterium]|nr:tRNA pseudouridine(38-40) synthase TruA [Bacillota bacterium]
MRNIKLTISYMGANYSGWQVQPNVPTVQGVLQDVLSTFFSQGVKLHGSGRTDEGVHALGQVAHFVLHSRDEGTGKRDEGVASRVDGMSGEIKAKQFAGVPLERLPQVVNKLLPMDIRLVSAEEVPLDFHARYSAKQKTYTYTMYVSDVESPMLEPYATKLKGEIDTNLAVKRMNAGLKYLVGEYDFSAFANFDKTRELKSAVRKIMSADVKRLTEHKVGGVGSDIIRLKITGNGFLQNMVRIIAGTLIGVAGGKLQPKDVGDILKSKDRTRASKTAAAKGLCLVEVVY